MSEERLGVTQLFGSYFGLKVEWEGQVDTKGNSISLHKDNDTIYKPAYNKKLKQNSANETDS